VLDAPLMARLSAEGARLDAEAVCQLALPGDAGTASVSSGIAQAGA
jgi:hypothetical protein